MARPWSGPSPLSSRSSSLNLHELLKQEAFSDISENCENHFEKNRPCPTSYGISDQYVVLDSFNKVPSSPIDRGEFIWNFMVQGVTRDFEIGVKDRIENVIEIQMSKFCLPILPEVPYILVPAPFPLGSNKVVLLHNNNNGLTGAPTLIPNAAPYGQYPPSILTPPSTFLIPWINNPYTQLPFCGHLTVQLKDIGLQSYSDANGARHHIEFEVKSGHNPNILEAIPLECGWDKFIFTDPIKDVHGLTLVFRNPDIPIKFEPDCYYDVSVFPSFNVLRFETMVPHNLLVGDRIFIRGFTSEAKALEVYVNRPEGHVVSSDPGMPPLPPSTTLSTPTFFWTDPAIAIIDFIPAPTFPRIVTVCVAKRRLRISLRMRRAISRLTNYITPV